MWPVMFPWMRRDPPPAVAHRGANFHPRVITENDGRQRHYSCSQGLVSRLRISTHRLAPVWVVTLLVLALVPLAIVFAIGPLAYDEGQSQGIC